MDGCSGKNDATGNMAHKKGYNASFREANTDEDHNAPYGSRMGCNGRIKYNSQNSKLKGYDKAKCSHSCISSSNGSEMIGNSSKSNSVMTRAKNSLFDSKRKLSSQLELDSSGSSQSDDSEVQEPTSSPSRSPTRHHSGSMNKSGGEALAEVGTSSVPSSMRSRKMFQHNSNSQQTSSGPSSPSISESSGSVTSNNKSRYRLRNLKCNSESDALTPTSPSESKSSGKYAMKKKVPEGGESSLARRGRQIAAESTYRHRFGSTSGISISDTRRNNITPGEGSSGAASVRTRRSVNLNDNRMRLSYRQIGRNDSTVRESAVRISRSPDSDVHINVDGQSASHQFSSSGSSSGLIPYGISSSNVDNRAAMVPYTSPDHGFTHVMNRDAFPLYNIDGIAEVLLALGRIEREEELTQEQVLSLETSLFLSGLNLYDQHRGMRMDIDNMSYEELLALEERMGSVSTALSEDQLLKCVCISIYKTTPSEVRVVGLSEDGDDVKCSICQDEYAVGDEIGKLTECQHGYHLMCINEWLRVKNWCPICKKAAAVRPQPSSSE